MQAAFRNVLNISHNYLKFEMKLSKSIEQLENDYWVDTNFPTDLVEKCHGFRKIPIEDLAPEQIRLLISQNIGTKFLLPLALKFLQSDILAEVEFYPGDLLSSILDLPKGSWEDNNSAQQQLKAMITLEKEKILKDNLANQHRQLLKKIDAFMKS
jgi:hypothetical protein